MSDLKEIRERHEMERRDYTRWSIDGLRLDGARALIHSAHSDRAFLLAEVDRLKALCGRAVDALDVWESKHMCCSTAALLGYTTEAQTLEAELREAAK